MPLTARFVGGGRSVVQDVLVSTHWDHGVTAAMAAGAGFREVRAALRGPDPRAHQTARRIRPDHTVTVYPGPEDLPEMIDRLRHTTVHVDGTADPTPELRTVALTAWRARPIVVVEDAPTGPIRDRCLKLLYGYDAVEENGTLYAFPPDAARPVFRRAGYLPHTDKVRFTLVVPQGIGDVVWVYQRFAPLCDELHFRIVEFGQGDPRVETRAVGTVGALPKVVAVDTVRVTEYPPALREQRRLSDVLPVLRAGCGAYYASNPWLEAGRELEAGDPDVPVQWDLGVPAVPPADLPARCVALYVSGDAVRHATLCERVWTPEQWVQCVCSLRARGRIDTGAPVALLGAGFDAPAVAAVGEGLRARGVHVVPVTDRPLPELLGVFARCSLFLGYQSGLNVLAGAVRCRQHMMYFPRFDVIGDKWVRPEDRGTGRFTWGSFAQSPEEVASAIRPLVG